MRCTDTHAHLSMVAARAGEAALRAVFAPLEERAAEADSLLSAEPFVVDIGVEPGDLQERRQLVERVMPHAGRSVRFTAGIWPGTEACADIERSLQLLREDLARGVCAVGECGLDYYHMAAPAKAQQALFEAQAELAREMGLPLVVHSREAFRDTCSIIKKVASSIPVVFHCFGYGPEEAKQCVDLGCLVSFAGNLTYRAAHALREAFLVVPSDRLLLETDAPYLHPEPGRGKPSTPLSVWQTCTYAASLKGMEPQALADLVGRNAAAIFMA
ncbi:MAG: TatD family hydrolase [Spirochaetaceae bacterium]|nr:TatD family hydrolase [Spirochaetaceae bacterium]